MNRYSKIKEKHPREILLLKGAPCRWGKCSFCDYIEDNSDDRNLNHTVNKEVLSQVTGEFGVLEVINSGNVFELPQETLDLIQHIIKEKKIHTLFFEAHWMYRKKLQKMREFFGVKCIVKTGLETFHHHFREQHLIKGFNHKSIEELQQYFDSVCLMVGIQGQTREMIAEDIKLAMQHFDHFTVNIFVENTTSVKPDQDLIQWFQEEYSWLNEEMKCDVLWVNTDFGVGDSL